jgi:hypothetical protein
MLTPFFFKGIHLCDKPTVPDKIKNELLGLLIQNEFISRYNKKILNSSKENSIIPELQGNYKKKRRKE